MLPKAISKLQKMSVYTPFRTWGIITSLASNKVLGYPFKIVCNFANG